MVRVRLLGSPQTQWNIDGHYYPGKDIVELTLQQISQHKKVIVEVLDSVEVKENVTPEPEKIETIKKIEKKTSKKLKKGDS